MTWLKKGQRLRSDESGRYYRVASHRLHEGGFGEVYQGQRLDDHEDDEWPVAIKVSDQSLSWHGEVFFGRLLSDPAHYVPVVPLRDALWSRGVQVGLRGSSTCWSWTGSRMEPSTTTSKPGPPGRKRWWSTAYGPC